MSETDFSNLPRWLPKQLKRAGLSKEKLAHRAGVSRTCIYRYIYDQDRPSEDTMLKMCRALDVSFEEGSQYVPKKNGAPFGGSGRSSLPVRKR